MHYAYVHIVLLLVIAAAFSGAFLLLSRLLGPHMPSDAKESTYECGVPVEGKLLGRFSIKFYQVVILFLLFDVEVVFLFPWAVQQYAEGVSWWLWFAEGVLFAAILLAGWVVVVKKGTLDWGTKGSPLLDDPKSSSS